MSKQENKKRVEIQCDDDIAQGMYVNLAMVNHSPMEFTFDFIYVPPAAAKAKVRARLITSPKHAKMFLKALEENVNRFEANFGEIDITKVPQKSDMMH